MYLKKQKLPFSIPPPPYKCLRNIWMVPGQDIFQKQACNINNIYITTHSKQDRKHIEKVIYYLFWDYCWSGFYAATCLLDCLTVGMLVFYDSGANFWLLKFVFSKKATKFEKNLHHRFDTYYILSNRRWRFRQFLRPS